MTARTRRSPKLASGYQTQDVRDAIDTLEDRPRIPEKTPASSSEDGYEGEVCQDATYLYLYCDGSWKRIAKSAF